MALRRIVMLRELESLQQAFGEKAYGGARRQLERRVCTPGMRFDERQYPVGVESGYAMPAEFDDDEAVERFVAHNPNDVRELYADPQIAPFPTVCPDEPVGSHLDVAVALNLVPLRAAGAEGRGVKIVVVDTGIDGRQIDVAGGYNPRPGVAPGTAEPDHGTMVAFDAQIAAPDALIFDYALLQSRGNTWVAFLSDAIRAFSEIMIDQLQQPGPRVAVNSWGMYDTSSDAPLGHPQSYFANPAHPFNQITGALVGSGVDVVFAAGNCGASCPDPRCGLDNVGPGKSIHGANSHPEVTCVAAVTVNDDRLGYSSEGPGTLAAEKPDLAGFSHFGGSGIYPADSGTSAACPVVAGVIAALRSVPAGRDLTPAQLRRLLNDAARGEGWNAQLGHGIVDAGAAFEALQSP